MCHISSTAAGEKKILEVCVCARERDRERQTKRERERDRHRERERETESKGEQERERERDLGDRGVEALNVPEPPHLVRWQGSWCGVWGLGFGVWGLGFRVQKQGLI